MNEGGEGKREEGEGARERKTHLIFKDMGKETNACMNKVVMRDEVGFG